jgi:hypothetical protein
MRPVRKIRILAVTSLWIATPGMSSNHRQSSRSFGDSTLQSPTVLISVSDSLSGQKIANADITELRSGIHRSTDANGEARLVWPPDGNLRFRVRQLGFTPATRELRRDDRVVATNTVAIALSRVRYVLPPVTTKDRTACATPADSVSAQLSAMTLEQIRLGAERYEGFRKAYPFRAKVIRRTATLDSNGKVTRMVDSKEEVNSDDWGDPYRAGEVVESTPFGFSVPILFLETLAEPEFWRNHCFVARGVEDRSGSRVIRLDFEPAPNIRSADWQGSALIDSATSILVRLDFRLAGLTDSSRPRRLEGYTTFVSPSPYFVVPDSTIAGWWKRGPARGNWGMPDVVQSLHVASIDYRKARPIGLDRQ